MTAHPAHDHGRSRRLEDEPVLGGHGRFIDDAHAADALVGWFVRSPHAFARIRSIDVTEARAAPGVRAVLTPGEMDAAGVGNVTRPLPIADRQGTPMCLMHRPSLPRGLGLDVRP